MINIEKMTSKKHLRLAEYWIDYSKSVQLNKKDLLEKQLKKEKIQRKRGWIYEY